MKESQFINPATPAVMRAGREKQTLYAGGGVVFLLIAGLAAGLHYEQPFLAELFELCPTELRGQTCRGPLALHLGFGLVCGLPAFPLMIFLFRFMPVVPTILCRACRGVGWIRDLAPDGACPRCQGHRFNAEIVTRHVARDGSLEQLQRVILKDADGHELLARLQAGEEGFA